MLSARNQFAGHVRSVVEGTVNGIVTLEVKGEEIKATISLEAIRALGLEPKKEATAFIKATEVMVATGDMKLSARNQFAGKVTSIEKGAVNSIVKIDAKIGGFTATISNAAVEELGLEEGKDATAVIKATEVMIGC